MTKIIYKLIIGIGAVIISSCHNSDSNGNRYASTTRGDSVSKSRISLRENVLTSEEQKKFNPNGIIQDLKDGNSHYAKK